VYLQIPRYRLEEQRSMASERKQLRGGGNGETDKQELCVLRQNIDAFWRKSGRAER